MLRICTDDFETYMKVEYGAPYVPLNVRHDKMLFGLNKLFLDLQKNHYL
jgi:hypothetical protein